MKPGPNYEESPGRVLIGESPHTLSRGEDLHLPITQLALAQSVTRPVFLVTTTLKFLTGSASTPEMIQHASTWRGHS